MSHIFKLFVQASERVSSNPAIIFQKEGEYERLSYSNLYERSLVFGNFLKSAGVQQGDKVGVILENQPEYPIAFFAIMYAGAVSVPLDIQFSLEQIQQIVKHSEIKVLIVTGKIYHKLKSQLQDVRFVIVDDSKFQNELKDFSLENQFDEGEEGGDKLAVLFYTSGTTDKPKGVMLTHYNLLENFKSLQQLNFVNQQDSVVSLLPLHHAYSFTVTLLIPLLLGASVVYPPGLTSSELLSCLNKTRPTIFVGVPQVFSLIHRSIKEKLKVLPVGAKFTSSLLGNVFFVFQKVTKVNLNKFLFSEIHRRFGGNLRFMVSGGARLMPEVAQDFTRWGFTLLEGYGLTETSPVSAFNPVNKPKIGSVGRSLPQVDIKIIDKNEKGIGEVAIQGPNVMAGYYKMPEKTQEVIKDGWLYSGDLGYFDRDGYLFLTGRKKELIVLSSGKNINPEEVEEHYGQCPYIKEMCVLDYQSEGLIEGASRLVAIIVMNEVYFRDKQVTAIYDKLKWELDNLSVDLPTYKRISGFVISKEALPRTRLGKLMRYKGRELYRNLLVSSKFTRESFQENHTEEDFSVLSRSAMAFFHKTLDREVDVDDHLELDLGLDSLGKVELLLLTLNHYICKPKACQEQSYLQVGDKEPKQALPS